VATLDSSDRRLAPTWKPKERAPEAADAAADAGTPGRERDQGVGAGPWLATLAAMLIVALLLWWRRRRRQPPAPFAADYAPKAPTGTGADEAAPAPDPMAEAIAEVAAAYDSGNPNQARSALLGWAALVWPDDAPGNLARLSLRLPEPLRTRVTLLEKAFFSPTPVDWISQPVVPLLEAVAARETEPRPETADQS
jgi:hypothetical protein